MAGIDKVRAMVFPAGQLCDGQIVPLPGLVLLRWRSDEADKLFQIYVNGNLAGVTSHFQQRTLLVQCDTDHPAAIEIVSMDCQNRYEDYSEELDGFKNSDGSHVVLTWPRRGVLPLDSIAYVYWNGGSGQIDYSEPLATQTIWNDPVEKWGWGLDGFGRGDFGYSGTGAAGWGCGSFAEGEFGFDAEVMCFESESLTLGEYKFAIGLADAQDNIEQEEISVEEFFIDPLPVAPGLAVESYDEQSDQLVLEIS